MRSWVLAWQVGFMLLHPDGHPVPQRLLQDSATSFREFFALPEDGAREPYPPSPQKVAQGKAEVTSTRRWRKRMVALRGVPAPVRPALRRAHAWRDARHSQGRAQGVVNSTVSPGLG
jgi:hypothetical protein